MDCFSCQFPCGGRHWPFRSLFLKSEDFLPAFPHASVGRRQLETVVLALAEVGFDPWPSCWSLLEELCCVDGTHSIVIAAAGGHDVRWVT